MLQISKFLRSTLENSNTQFPELFESSNKFFGPLNITHFIRQKSFQYLESRYLEYLGSSNRIVGPLNDFLTFYRTFVLTFRPKFESSIKFERFLPDVFLRRMAPVKRKLTKKSLTEKCKALKDLENSLSNKDVATKYGVPRNTISTWVKNKHKLTVSLEKKGINSSRKKKSFAGTTKS